MQSVWKYNGNLLLEFGEDLGDVGLVGEADHDVQLLQFDVDRVVILDEEHFHLVFQDIGPVKYSKENSITWRK